MVLLQGSTLKDFEEYFTLEELKEMEKIVKKSLDWEKAGISSLKTGTLAGLAAYGSIPFITTTTATSTAIAGLSSAVATNMAFLGGGTLASLGGLGIAGGMLLGGVVAAPALAVGGFVLAGQAEEALTKAKKYSADVDEAISNLDLVKAGLEGLSMNATEVSSTLYELVQRFEQVKVYDDYNQRDFDKMMIIGKSIKKLLDYRIMRDDGSPIPNIKSICSGYLKI